MNNFESSLIQSDDCLTVSKAAAAPAAEKKASSKSSKGASKGGDESSSDEFYNVLKPIAGASLASQSRKVRIQSAVLP